MSKISKLFKMLKNKIEETPFEKLDELKDSIAVSDLHPQIKEACFQDIDYRQNRSVYANDAVVAHGDDIGEIS